ncbi:basic leucine zipper transcriptional factor ATF-like 2 [Entelurus aequoreus]|uniref:basic leucine zipper transcriptional factor ATF-like 2 n=1 Tax=Entelurus aequoreus TaxID=161455 RepID=UPI002B1DA540|nr:basic leucine zipper transcriptional factor ATF-like 2 [Entelurus aequoreus]
MSPLFMETCYQTTSPGSAEGHSSSQETETEGHTAKYGQTKRQRKNRDAARKSRKKQMERADELHQELQQLERSNSDFQKEIKALKKDVHRYTTALERHKPYCRLGASALTTTSSQAPEPVDINKSPRLSLSSALSSHSIFPPAPHSVFFSGFPTPASTEIDNLFHLEFQGMATSTTLPSEPPLSAESLEAPLLDPHEFTGNPDNSDYQCSTSFAQASEDLALKPSEELMSASKLLLSLLSNPSPSGNLPTSSSNLDVPFRSNASSLAVMEECPGNLSFSDLLEDNEWILNAGTSD